MTHSHIEQQLKQYVATAYVVYKCDTIHKHKTMVDLKEQQAKSIINIMYVFTLCNAILA